MSCFKGGRGILVALITLMFSLLPEIGASLGFGEIKLYSYLNEPLEAEIELTGIEETSADQLVASLASAEDFEKSGITRPYFLSKLRFQIVKQKNHTVIHVTSEEVVKQPYLEFLALVTWPEGRLARGYTLLLDPVPLGNTPRPEVKPLPKKSAFSDKRALQGIQEKLSKNLYSLKPTQVASMDDTLITERHLDPGVQNLERLFDPEPEFDSGSLAVSSPIEKSLPVSIESSLSEDLVEAENEAEVEVEPVLTPESFTSRSAAHPFISNKLLLGSSLGLLFSVTLTVWILKRARESLTVTPKRVDSLKDTQLFDEEINIKLDLANQYVTIHDHKSAREILEEVLLRGNNQEIERARTILEKISS